MLRPRIVPIQANCLFFRACIWFLTLPVLSQAGEGWRIVGEDRGSGQVHLKCPANCEIQSDRPFFVITHGMHGTCEGDRFHLLAETIATVVSDANVVLIDWSAASSASSVPMFVAWRIDSIADEASQDLCDLGFQAEQATLIGESFGNYLNARIATDFGRVDHLIAMNPASELGGYPVPDLRRCSRVSWSFHTYSILDTRVTLAHATILLETRDDATDIEKHTCGIERLTERLEQGDLEWLVADRVLPDNSTQEYRVLATLDGKLVETDSPKIHVSPQEEVPHDEQSDSTPAT